MLGYKPLHFFRGSTLTCQCQPSIIHRPSKPWTKQQWGGICIPIHPASKCGMGIWMYLRMNWFRISSTCLSNIRAGRGLRLSFSPVLFGRMVVLRSSWCLCEVATAWCRYYRCLRTSLKVRPHSWKVALMGNATGFLKWAGFSPCIRWVAYPGRSTVQLAGGYVDVVVVSSLYTGGANRGTCGSRGGCPSWN